MSKQRGLVILSEFSSGSKSQGERVVLKTDDAEYVLRMQGGNPFNDPSLRDLVGKTVVATGDIHGYTFIMSDWREA